MKKHYLYLDAARGIAAISVAIYHFRDFLPAALPFKGSFLAVDLFFLMSGFVICRSYESRLQDGTMNFFSFAKTRIIRLYPLYLLATAIGFLYHAAKIYLHMPDTPTVGMLLAAVPTAVLMLPSSIAMPSASSSFPFAPSAWSLSLELWFNLVWALGLYKMSSRRIGYLTLISAAVLLFEGIKFGTVDLGWGFSTLLGGSARFWFSFLLGILICRFRNKFSAIRIPLWPVALLAVLFINIPSHNILLQFIWISAVFPLFVFLALRSEPTGRATALSDFLGRTSYAIYILHAPLELFLFGLLKAFFHADPVQLAPFSGIVVVMLIIIASSILTFWYDEPLRRKINFLGKVTASKKLAQSKSSEQTSRICG